MQIVIDIPNEKSEKLIRQMKLDRNFRECKIIELSKGHGRLIDADYLKDVSLLHNFHGNNKNIVPYADRRGYRLRQREVDEAIINAPTIIEADKENEDADI